MKSDKYFYLPKAFSRDTAEREPESVLQSGTKHPELNSFDFQSKIYQGYKDETCGYCLPTYNFFEPINNHFILCMNDFKSELGQASILGLQTFETIAERNAEQILFQLPQESAITNFLTLNSSSFLVASKNGELQHWDEQVTGQTVKVFRIGKKSIDGFATSAVKLAGEGKKFAIGSNKGHIDIIDYESELSTASQFPYAHGAEITGVSSCSEANNSLVSCSLDRHCKLWDLNAIKAKTLLKHDHQLTAVHWSSQDLIVLGDEVGNVMVVDVRQPKKVLSTMAVANRGISKLHFTTKQKFGVVSRSNIVKVLRINEKGELETAYEHIASSLVLGMSWDKNDNEAFYVIGDQQLAEKVKM